MGAKRHAQPTRRLWRTPSQDMFVPLKFGQFRMNEQVRVVTRSFHPAWGGGSTFVSAAALSQDECIIAKTAADGAAVFDETPSLKAPRLQTVRNLLSILFRLFCIIGHGALKPQHTIAR